MPTLMGAWPGREGKGKKGSFCLSRDIDSGKKKRKQKREREREEEEEGGGNEGVF